MARASLTGETVLRALVALAPELHRDGPLAPAASAARIAGWLQGELELDAQPRQVAARLRVLADAGLAAGGPRARRLKSGRIKSYRSGATMWTPTARGRDVDALLDRIVVARGGRFAGWCESGLTSAECVALR